MIVRTETVHRLVLGSAAGVEQLEVGRQLLGVGVAVDVAREVEHAGGEGGKDQLALEAQQIQDPAALDTVESAHGHPTLVLHQALFGPGRDRHVGAPALGLLSGVGQHRSERVHASAAQAIPLGRVDEVVEEVGQLHHVAVGIEDGSPTGVGHGDPPELPG